MDYELILSLLSFLVRFLGLVVLGVGLGWFSLYAYRELADAWQLKIAVFLGLLGFLAVVVRFESPGAEGGFALGVGIALLAWGLRKTDGRETEEAKKK
jgi:hypothetical protein